MPLGSEAGRRIEKRAQARLGKAVAADGPRLKFSQDKAVCVFVSSQAQLCSDQQALCVVFFLIYCLWLEGFNYYLWCPWNREGEYLSLGGTASLQKLALCHREHLGGKPRPGCPHPFWLRTCSKTDTHNFSAHYQPNDTVVLSLGMRRNRLFLGN